MNSHLLKFWMLVILSSTAIARAEITSSTSAHLLTINGPIGPSVSDYITRGISDAEQAGAELILLQIDTPGGLDSAMRDIIKSILNAPMPVVGFVAPEGARAASAGTYILYACHVAAMAPATNLGAATPVQIGGGGSPMPGAPGDAKDKPKPARGATAMEKKQINDAVAYIRGLADLRNRNADWAEQAVREGASLSANEALQNNVIDLIAGDWDKLLQAIHHREIEFNGKPRTLQTANVEIIRITPDWRSDMLGVIANPNMAYILLLIGIYGLIFEFSNPGLGGPGIIGAICLFLALYAFQILPVSYVGLGLIALGVALMVAEAFAPSFGILGVGGGIAFVVGSIILMDTDLPAYQIAFPLIAGFALSSFLLFGVGLNMAMRARKLKYATGNESWIGKKAIASEAFIGKGHVRVEGERWRAECSEPVEANDEVIIDEINGLTLKVHKKT
ncbi:MAG: nodulation protein NfeD [Ketobacteraceae bacterium]|nr:nodulation protein NfeD [Ketobacteraceae bacterium]